MALMGWKYLMSSSMIIDIRLKICDFYSLIFLLSGSIDIASTFDEIFTDELRASFEIHMHFDRSIS